MSLRGALRRPRAQVACLTLAVGLAVGLLAPGAAASTLQITESSASAETAPDPTTIPTAAPTAVPSEVTTTEPSPAATAQPIPDPTASPDLTASAPIPSGTPTPDPSASAPVPAPADGEEANPSTVAEAVAFDGEIVASSGPGSITLSIPPRSSTGRFDAGNVGYFVTQENGVGVALDIVEQVPVEGLPARIIDVDLPYSADWTVSVQTSGVDDGVEVVRTEPFRQTFAVLSVFDTCADGLDRSQFNEPFTVDAVGGERRIDVTVGALTLPDCFDQLQFRVLVKKANNDDEQAGEELGPILSDATFDGTTVSGAFAPGRYFVVVLVDGVVDGESGSLFQVFDPSVNQPSADREFIEVTGGTAFAVSTGGSPRLASTGADAAGPASGAAALLAAGLVALVVARRRSSAPGGR